VATTTHACENSAIGCLSCSSEASCSSAGCAWKNLFFFDKCVHSGLSPAIDLAKDKVNEWKQCKTAATCSPPGCGLVGSICMPAAAADTANLGISQGSAKLKALGNDIDSIVSNVFGTGATATSIKTKLEELTGGDVVAIATSLDSSIKSGEVVGKDITSKLVSKMKETSAWGEVASWTVDNVEMAGTLVDGLSVADLQNLQEDVFDATVAQFGNVKSWAQDQAKELGKRFTAGTSVSTLTGAALNDAQGFLNGLEPNQLQQIDAAAFSQAKPAFMAMADKLQAFSESQITELGNKVKTELGKSAGMLTAADLSGLGSLIGTLEATDLAQIPTSAVAGLTGSAVRLMDPTKIRALTAEQIRGMTLEARKAFNGGGLQALATSLQKVKAVVGCLDAPSECPAAIVDIVVTHDWATMAAAILASIRAALETAGQPTPDCTATRSQSCIEVVEQDVERIPSTAPSQRRTVTGGRQTVVRVNAATTESAAAAANTTSAIGSSTVVTLGSQGCTSSNSPPVTVVDGWNWIAVPSTQELSNLNFPEATVGDVIKSQTAASMYYEGHGWFGTLTKLEPGVGYKLKVSRSGSITFDQLTQ